MNRRGAQCLVCEQPVPIAAIRVEGKAKRMGVQMLAIVADGPRGRAYLAPTKEQERFAANAAPAWAPETELPERALGFRVQGYGLTRHRDLFTDRQLLAMTTFADAIREVRGRVEVDALSMGMSVDATSLEFGGAGTGAYATAVATYLALALDRLADYCSNLCIWNVPREQIGHVFGRQTLSMTWDFAEVNPFSDSSGNFGGALAWVKKCIAAANPGAPATVRVADAAASPTVSAKVIATDPPYYDNVPYADLSDFFYVWLRSAVGDAYPETMATLLVPKREELVADPARFGNSPARARDFFEQGLRRAFVSIREQLAPGIPATIFYAFKQTERDNDDDLDNNRAGRASVGWETMLAAVIDAGMSITGTWPLTSERPSRLRSIDSNALASSIVLVCRPRASGAPICGRADFLHEIRSALPLAVQHLRDASLAATDLQQAALGPGMAIFSKYRAVLEADDRPMSVRSALKLINDELGQILLGEIADVDAETQFALGWFDRFGYDAGKYGEADMLLRSKNANAGALKATGVLELDAGIVQLRDPRSVGTLLNATDAAAPAWSQMVALIAALVKEDGGEDRAAAVLRAIGIGNADRLKSIAYHCYLVCDERKRTAQARDFNTLIAAWPEMERRAADPGPRQETFE